MANTEYRDAVRIMFILNEKGAEPNLDPATKAEFPLCFKGETRLQALDFWVRYPDYLADELLDQYKTTGDQTQLDAVKAIFDANEPSERAIPMLRRYFGAYERLDTVLAILATSRLVRPITIQDSAGKNTQHFLISDKLAGICAQIVADHPIFEWYAARAKLVTDVAGNRKGADLKIRQHQQKEYHETQIDDLIPTIAERVRKRLEGMAA